MADERIFVGFSTAHVSKKRSWVLYDIDLIKQDLTYQFNTRIGERVMRPTYGCAIWDYLNEQLTDDIVEKCRAEVERIVSLDIRCEVVSVAVDTIPNGIIVVADLLYRPFNIVDSFRIAFDGRQ